MNRRSFLTMIGMATVGMPIAKLSPPEAPILHPRGTKTIVFKDPNGAVIGDEYVIPADWWDIKNGIAGLKNPITINNVTFSAIAASAEIRRDGEWLVRFPLTAPVNIARGDTIHLSINVEVV